MPPKRAKSPRRPSPRRATNVGTVAQQEFTALMNECVEAAQRLVEGSGTCTVKQQQEAKRMLKLVQKASERRPTLLRTQSPRSSKAAGARG